MAWGTKSRHERGYDYAWTKRREEIMKRDAGRCQPCQRAGRLGVGAHAVDHIVSKAKAKELGWTREQMDDPSNLEAICNPCHSAKTEAEQGKRKRPRKVIGDDGWPT